ncbi:MAG: hypothetical protein IT425_04965 [Pirellulales bacterium]|nr:hypothetical protein [Pirellulales bacterium]
MRKLCTVALVTVFAFFATYRPALAVMQFYTSFKKDYLEKLDDKEFAAEVGKTSNRCLVCHQGKKSKKNLNALGTEMSKLITKKQKNEPEKIAEALKNVLEMRVDPKDKESETYLDRLKASKWPAGTLEELQKEPKEPKEEPKEKEEQPKVSP